MLVQSLNSQISIDNVEIELVESLVDFLIYNDYYMYKPENAMQEHQEIPSRYLRRSQAVIDLLSMYKCDELCLYLRMCKMADQYDIPELSKMAELNFRRSVAEYANDH